MNLDRQSVVVSGGASGLGLATAMRLSKAGAVVTIVDLPGSPGARVAADIGGGVRFAAADVTDAEQFAAALDAADQAGPLRAVVHTAGRGARIRLVDADGSPGGLAPFEEVVRLNVIGSYNALRLGAARMARHEPLDGERGVVVLTASVAAFEGQIGQIAYSAAKAGIAGMTLPAARDLASKAIRVVTIAPGVFDTPLVQNVLRPDIRQALEESVPFPKRLGESDEYAALAVHVLENSYLNGTTVRLDGAIRMAPR